eukprot:4519151-Amphidinium_carterae.1
MLLQSGRRREIQDLSCDVVDFVVFTDGSWPSEYLGETGEPRVGALFVEVATQKVQYFSEVVSDAVIQQWLPRKTQIVMVELLAAVLVQHAFADSLAGKRCLLFVDSTAVESALVRGYSSRDDLCMLVAEFWIGASRLDVLWYIDRVSSDSNPADEPSRGELSELDRAGASRVVVSPAVAGAWVRGLGCEGFESPGPARLHAFD